MTNQQKEAAADQKRKVEFLYECYCNGATELGLFGVAGTGKTQAAIELLSKIQARHERLNTYLSSLVIIGAAVSHGAKNVLKDRLDTDDVEYMTVASLLQLKRQFHKDGTIFFAPVKKRIFKRGDFEEVPLPIYTADVIIIDECSQISSDMYRMINEEKGPDTVIIYLGDWHQTPPVEEDADLKTIEEDSPTFNVEHKAILTIPFRYEGDIQELATAIAAEIDKPNKRTLKFLEKFKKEQGKDYIFYDSNVTFFGKLFSALNMSNHLKENILVNYRNEVTSTLARAIRKKLQGSTEYRFAEDDKIVCKRGNPNVEGLDTHKTFLVTDVALAEVQHGGYGDSDFHINNFFIKIGEGSYSSRTSICILLLTLVDSSGKVYKQLPVLQDPEDTYFKDIQTDLFYTAKKSGSSMDWVKYYQFTEFFYHFEFASSVNTYVVQGDTYENVYVNLKDILSVQPTSMKQKLQSFYTAVTRAKKKVHILI